MVESDFRGLRRLSMLAAERFVAGAVLYTGGQPLRFGPNLYALPISTLWA